MLRWRIWGTWFWLGTSWLGLATGPALFGVRGRARKKEIQLFYQIFIINASLSRIHFPVTN